MPLHVTVLYGLWIYFCFHNIKKTFVTFTMYNLVSFNILLFGGIYMFEVYMFGNLMRRFISAFTIITIKIINFFTEMNSKVH